MSDTAQQAQILWHEIHSDLLRFVQRRVDDDALAEDIVQEVFLRIHQHIDSLEDSQRLRGWVYTIARNCITDTLRRRRASSVLESEPAEEGEVEENLNGEVAGWLASMVGDLPEKYREAVRLSELDGTPQKKIADQLGLSLSGAKSRVQRGRQMLREALLNCCHFEFDQRGNVIDYGRRESCAGCCDAANDCSP